MQNGREVYETAYQAGWRPEPRLSVSAWADEHRVLGNRAGHAAIHWRTSVLAGTACIIRSFINNFAKHTPYRRSTTPLVLQFAPTDTFDFCSQFTISIFQKLLQSALSDSLQGLTQRHFNIANSNPFRFCLRYCLSNDFCQHLAYLVYLFNVGFSPDHVFHGYALQQGCDAV